MTENERRRSGQLEAQIVTVLAEAGRALTTGEVRELLPAGTPLSYSAVVTTLTRLHNKGAVTRERRGRAFHYTAVVDAAGLVADRMNSLLTAGPDAASVLRRFVGTLGKRDEQILRELLSDEPD